MDYAKGRVMTWQSDKDAVKCGCPGCESCGAGKDVVQACGRLFKGVSEGKHHCRLCGKIFCDGCSRGRVTLPPKAEYDGPAPAGGGGSSAESSEDGGGEPLRACEICYRDCNRYVLLPRAVKRGLKSAETSAVHCM